MSTREYCKTITQCITLQHAAIHCNTLQHTSTAPPQRQDETRFFLKIVFNSEKGQRFHRNALVSRTCTNEEREREKDHGPERERKRHPFFHPYFWIENTRKYPQSEPGFSPGHSKYTATRCNTMQHSATLCNMPQHLQHTLQQSATLCNTLQHSATPTTLCNTLQHTATRCNTLQHVATQCNT